LAGGIEPAGEVQVAQRQVGRMYPGAAGGEPAGGLAEGEAGEQPGAQRGRRGRGAGVEPGERVQGRGQRGEQRLGRTTSRMGSGRQPGPARRGRGDVSREVSAVGGVVVCPDRAEPEVVVNPDYG